MVTLFQSLGFPRLHSRQLLPGRIWVMPLTIGLPAVLETCRFGYDGKGRSACWKRQRTSRPDGRGVLKGVPLMEKAASSSIASSRIPRRAAGTGETAFYPLVENHIGRGILRLSRVPVLDVSESVQKQAADYKRAFCNV